MSVRSVLFLFLCALGVLFLALNWTGIMSDVPVNLIYTEVKAPLGLIVLLMVGVLWVVGVVWSLMQQAAALVDIRSALKESKANKTLAEHAEASRVEAVKAAFTTELDGLDKKVAERFDSVTLTQSRQVGAILDEVKALRTALDETNANVRILAEKLKVEMPEAEPQPEAKKEKSGGFFGLFSHKEEPAKPAEKPVVEAKPQQ